MVSAEVEDEVEAVSAVYFDDLQDAAVFDSAGSCCLRVRIRFSKMHLSSETLAASYETWNMRSIAHTHARSRQWDLCDTHMRSRHLHMQ